MSLKDYELAMFYIEKIKGELDKIAMAVGHPSFDEYFEAKRAKLPKAA